MKSMVKTGRFEGAVFSRLSNRFAVRKVVSSPIKTHPKLLAGASNHDWISATIAGVEPQVYEPIAPTVALALTAAEKSPPVVDQKSVLKKV